MRAVLLSPSAVAQEERLWATATWSLCQPHLRPSPGIWRGLASCQHHHCVPPPCLCQYISALIHTPSLPRLFLQKACRWRAFQRGIMNQTLSRCFSLLFSSRGSPLRTEGPLCSVGSPYKKRLVYRASSCWVPHHSELFPPLSQ